MKEQATSVAIRLFKDHNPGWRISATIPEKGQWDGFPLTLFDSLIFFFSLLMVAKRRVSLLRVVSGPSLWND